MQVGIKGQCGIPQNYLNCFEARPGVTVKTITYKGEAVCGAKISKTVL